MSQKFTILYLLRSILVKIYPRFEIRSSLSRNRRDEFSRREIPPFLISGISMPRRVRQGIPALSARRGEREREREREREKEFLYKRRTGGTCFLRCSQRTSLFELAAACRVVDTFHPQLDFTNEIAPD